MDSEGPTPANLAERAWTAIAAVRDPELGMSLGDLGMVRGVEVRGTTVCARIALTIAGCPLKERIAGDVAAALRDVPGVDGVEVTFDAMGDSERGALVAGLRGGLGPDTTAATATAVLAVASGKGGVGKSTVTVNLACAMAAMGLRVGILDADVWGFSVPRLLGVTTRPVGFDGLLLPAEAHGVKLMSVGLFAQARAPVVWRGPLLHKTMRQFVTDVRWGELDVLLCDLPPGTGDVPISLAAMLPGARVVVVTTPQEAAWTVAERAGRMAEHSQLEVAGVIENMSGFVCPCCGEAADVFGDGGGELLADELGVELLARVPLDRGLRAAGDAGVPLVVTDPQSPAALALRGAAAALAEHPRPAVAMPLPLVSVTAWAGGDLRIEGSVQR